MDFENCLKMKLSFIKNYLGGQGYTALELPYDWFWVSEQKGERDTYGNVSFKIIDLFKKNEDYIIRELKKYNISVRITRKSYIFKKC